MVKDDATGYSNTVVFKNPNSVQSKQYHGAGLQLGKIGNDKLKPVVVVRNTSNNETMVKVKVPYTKEDGQKKKVRLDPITLAPKEIHKVDMTEVKQLQDVKVAGIEIKYTGRKGSVVASAQSVSQSKTQVFRTLLWDILGHRSATGGYPFYIEGSASSKAYIKNGTNREQEYVSFLIYGDNQQYMIGSNKLAPNEAVELDIKKIRDEQIPDENGNTLPIDITEGQIQWTAQPKEENENKAIPDNLGMIGQMIQVDTEKGINSTYFCANCCTGTTVGGHVFTNTTDFGVGTVAQFIAVKQEETCYATPYSFQFTPDSWSTSNSSIATISNLGLATLIGVGTTQVTASFQARETFETPPCGGGGGGPPLLLENSKDKKIAKKRTDTKNGDRKDKEIPTSNLAPCDGCEDFYYQESFDEELTVKPKVEIPDIGSIEKGSVRTITVRTRNAPANHTTTLRFKNKPATRGSDRKWTTGKAKFVNSADQDVDEISYMGDQDQQIRIRGVERSRSKKNVKLEARFGSNSNVEKSKKFTISSVEFLEDDDCTGFDDVEFQRTNDATKRNFFVPRGGDNQFKARVRPSGATGNFNLTSNNSAITITPSVINSTSTSTSTFTVMAQTGTTTTRGKIEAKANNPSNLTKVAETLNVDALKRINRNLVLYAVGEENDDAQLIKQGRDNLPSNSICITSGSNGFLDTKANSNDVVTTDPNNSSLQGITAGSNGKCNSEANNEDIDAPDNSDLPSTTDVQNYLNNITWGRQANVHFNESIGTPAEFKENFDLDRDEKLHAEVSRNELGSLRQNQTPPSGTYNFYFLDMEFTDILANPITAAAERGQPHAFFGELYLSGGNAVNRRTEAHELGHNFGLLHSWQAPPSNPMAIDEDYKNDLMFYANVSNIVGDQCRIRKRDWDMANQ